MKCQEIKSCSSQGFFKINDEGIKTFQNTIVVGNENNGMQKVILLDQEEPPDIHNGKLSSARIKDIKPIKNEKKKKYYTFAKNGRTGPGGKRNNKILLKINTHTHFMGHIDGLVEVLYGTPRLLKKGFGTDKNKSRWWEYLCILTPTDVLLLTPLGSLKKYVIYFLNGHLIIKCAEHYNGKYKKLILKDRFKKPL